MSRSTGKQIECRNCEELVPADGKNCHHCGTSIRSPTGPAVAAVLGSVIFLATVAHGVVNSNWNLIVYGLAALAVAVVGGYGIYERRERMTSPEA